MNRKLPDRRRVNRSIHPCLPGQISFNTCVIGVAWMARKSPTGWGKSGWKKKKWLRVWSTRGDRIYTKHKHVRGC